MKVFLTIFSLTYFFVNSFAQVQITGYVFESGNRGYISEATVTISNESQTQFYGEATTAPEGEYRLQVSGPGTYFLSVEKAPYFDYQEMLVIDESNGQSVYVKHEIKRNPGYVFEITLAEKNPEPDAPKDALKGALVEVYNNTKKQEVLVIENLQDPNFKVDLLKGNHYTVLIRKPGFLSKRMEAFVDVEGCILCFEGVGRVTPGVADNLTEGNTMGVLLANVEMDRYYAGKVIGLNNIYYDFGKASLTSEAKAELNKVAEFLKDNPLIKVELGSHTDSRGGASANLKLSERRAQSAVGHLIDEGGVAADRISGKGYGELELANKCGDNVECSEEEHQLNRRTELKIIDVISESGYRMLRQMKADELMDEILAELDNSAQIQVKEGENLEDAINNQSGITTVLAQAPSGEPDLDAEVEFTLSSGAKTKEQVIQEETGISTIEKEKVVGTIEEMVEIPDPAQEEILSQDEVQSDIKKYMPPAPVSLNEMSDQTLAEVTNSATMEEEIEKIAVNSETPPMEEMSKSSELFENKELAVTADLPTVDAQPKTTDMPNVSELREEIIKETHQELEPPVQSQSEVQNAVVEEKTQMNEGASKGIGNSDTEADLAEWVRPGSSVTFEYSNTSPDNSDRYGPSYSGYKVVVIFSRYELPPEHIIYKTYDQVDIYTTADNNKLYMLGSYPSRKTAESYLDTLREEYPHAYVVGFENGVRIY